MLINMMQLIVNFQFMILNLEPLILCLDLILISPYQSLFLLPRSKRLQVLERALKALQELVLVKIQSLMQRNLSLKVLCLHHLLDKKKIIGNKDKF